MFCHSLYWLLDLTKKIPNNPISTSQLVKNNFYADKMDVTAWNDFGAEPRAPDFVKNGKHSGSRHAMFNLRKNIEREVCQKRLDAAEAKKPQYSTRRVALMTNVAIENS